MSSSRRSVSRPVVWCEDGPCTRLDQGVGQLLQIALAGFQKRADAPPAGGSRSCLPVFSSPSVHNIVLSPNFSSSRTTG